MIADIILGNNIDTQSWIRELFKHNTNHIIVLDYDYYGEQYTKEDVLYISLIDMQNYMSKFDTVYFYKSLYGYPGMNGKMSSLFTRDN